MKKTAHGGWIATTARSLAPFALYQPRSIAEVMGALEAAPGATLLAGGTDLAGQFNEGLRPAAVVELRRVQELAGIRRDDGELAIGSAVTHFQAAQDPQIQACLPGLVAAWRQIATVRIRNRGTLGGNLLARRTRYELPVMLTALRAALHFVGPQGPQVLAPEALWTQGSADGALLTHVAIPLADGTVFAYDRSLRPALTLAVALRRSAGGWSGHAAVATEWLRPCLLPLPPAARLRELRQAAGPVAAAAFAHLPEDFADCAAPRWYLAQAGQVLLARTLGALTDA